MQGGLGWAWYIFFYKNIHCFQSSKAKPRVFQVLSVCPTTQSHPIHFILLEAGSRYIARLTSNSSAPASAFWVLGLPTWRTPASLDLLQLSIFHYVSLSTHPVTYWWALHELLSVETLIKVCAGKPLGEKNSRDGDTALRGLLSPGKCFVSIVGMSSHREQITRCELRRPRLKGPRVQSIFFCCVTKKNRRSFDQIASWWLVSPLHTITAAAFLGLTFMASSNPGHLLEVPPADAIRNFQHNFWGHIQLSTSAKSLFVPAASFRSHCELSSHCSVCSAWVQFCVRQ